MLGAAALLLLGPPAARAQTYQQVWADEFTNGIGSGWQFENGGGGWGNNEQQYYQPANATVVNGELQITARKQAVGGYSYTSTRMKTQGLREFTYGKIEARIRRPLGQGLWPAFWMLGGNIGSVGWPRCGEIDVMEHINTDNRAFGTVHWDNNGHAEYGGNVPVGDGYHVYSVEWTPGYIRWFVDGAKYHEINIANNAGGTEEFQRPFFLLLNLAVAGNWPGQAVDESRLPATMFVDYVRVYQLTNTPPPPSNFSVTLQAEAAGVNNGMVVEGCADAGGGQDMGYVDAGDYLVWNNVNFPSAGTYLIEYRVASGAGGGTVSSDLSAGSVQFGNTAIPATGGWQNWTTVSKSVTVNAGTYNFGVYAQTGGWNLNWVRISKTGGRAALASTAADNQQVVSVYPNPVLDRLTLDAAPAFVGGEVSILSVEGRVVWRGTYGGRPVDVSALKPGLYTLALYAKGQPKLVSRFSKQ